MASVATFFRPLNDISVFVEDEGSEAWYAELLTRLADGKVRIARVFPMRGKPALVEACQAFSGTGPALFLCDGDFEWVRGDPLPCMPRLFVFPAYCVENVLICEAAAAELLAESTGKLTADRARALLGWQAWAHSVASQLLPVVALYALVNVYAPCDATISRGVSIFLTQGQRRSQPSLDPEKVACVRKQREDQLDALIGVELRTRLVGEILARHRDNPLAPLSGKDLLLPLFRFLIINGGAGSIPDDSMRFRLARHCSLEPLRDLRNALVQTAAGFQYDPRL